MAATTLRDEHTLVYRFQAGGADSFWLARQLFEQWLKERRVRADAVGDLLVVLTELCTAEAAAGGLVLRAGVEGDGVALTVEAGATAVLPVDTPGGDLRLAAALCDELVLRVRPDKTSVTARRHGVVLPG
jgi:hypothetical protein